MKKHSNLPHIDLIGYYQFVTFRTFDSVDDFLKRYRKVDLSLSKKEYIIDKYLDSSKNGRYLEGKVLEFMYSFLKYLDSTYYELVAFAIMPNHIHILFKQIKPLKETINIIKGISAKEINSILKREGKFWDNGYFDKVIRDTKHFEITYNYIKNNPLKVNLDIDKRFYGIYG